MTGGVLFAFLMTLFAGLATGIGSAIAFFAKHTNRKFLSFSLGFSAGVMLYISFVELLFQARTSLTISYGIQRAGIIAAGSFFFGMLLAAIIDKIVPSFVNPHEPRAIEDMSSAGTKNHGLHRIGIITAVAVAIHNFPEGIATFVAAIQQPEIGVAIAIAIAIHNIPEGIAVSVPIYHATGSKRKAFLYSMLSGLVQPVGAILAYLILMPFVTPTLMDCTFAAVAGIMVYISLDELLPAARKYGEHHISIYGLSAGMVVMAISLIALMS